MNKNLIDLFTTDTVLLTSDSPNMLNIAVDSVDDCLMAKDYLGSMHSIVCNPWTPQNLMSKAQATQVDMNFFISTITLLTTPILFFDAAIVVASYVEFIGQFNQVGGASSCFLNATTGGGPGQSGLADPTYSTWMQLDMASPIPAGRIFAQAFRPITSATYESPNPLIYDGIFTAALDGAATQGQGGPLDHWIISIPISQIPL